MRIRLLVSAAATVGIVLGTATAAQAAEFGECAGIATASPGHYVLTTDATCDLSLLGDGAYVDLAGHTLYTGDAQGSTHSVVDATGVTIAGGNLRTNGIFWVLGGGRLDRVDVSAIDPAAATGFLLEAGPSFTVTRSHFHDLPNATALDFYFGDGGTVSDSRFTRTAIGVSIQSGSTFTIERSHFVENGIGLNLWNEDWFGVNDVTVTDSSFTRNTTTGIRVQAYKEGVARTFDNVQILGNRMLHNGGSGIDVTVYCITPGECTAGQTSVSIRANQLKHNGSSAPAGTGDDGITARAMIGGGPDVGTEGLSVVTVADNTTNKNADRGFDVLGVTDGGGNRSLKDAAPCLGVTCR